MNDLKTTSVLQKLYKNSTRGSGKLSQHPCNKPSSALLQLVSGIFCFQNVENTHKQIMKSKTKRNQVIIYSRNFSRCKKGTFRIASYECNATFAMCTRFYLKNVQISARVFT